MSGVVVGVDCSTKRLAFVTIAPDEATHGGHIGWQVLDASKNKGWQQRLLFLADKAETFFTDLHIADGACLVYVEEPPMGRSYRASLEVGYVVGMVLVEAMRAGHLAVPVNPSTWKKQTVGSGKADKDLIREWATHYVFGATVELPKEQDVYDAACIAKFAQQNLGAT